MGKDTGLHDGDGSSNSVAFTSSFVTFSQSRSWLPILPSLLLILNSHLFQFLFSYSCTSHIHKTISQNLQSGLASLFIKWQKREMGTIPLIIQILIYISLHFVYYNVLYNKNYIKIGFKSNSLELNVQEEKTIQNNVIMFIWNVVSRRWIVCFRLLEKSNCTYID